MPPPPVGQLAMRRRLRRHFGYANLGCTILVLAATHVHHHVLCYAGVKVLKKCHTCANLVSAVPAFPATLALVGAVSIMKCAANRSSSH